MYRYMILSAGRVDTVESQSQRTAHADCSEGQFRFVVNTRENSFEPPHVHVWVGNQDVCRVELNGGTFMESPPAGTFRNIMKAYTKHAEEIRKVWDAIHGR